MRLETVKLGIPIDSTALFSVLLPRLASPTAGSQVDSSGRLAALSRVATGEMVSTADLIQNVHFRYNEARSRVVNGRAWRKPRSGETETSA